MLSDSHQTSLHWGSASTSKWLSICHLLQEALLNLLLSPFWWWRLPHLGATHSPLSLTMWDRGFHRGLLTAAKPGRKRTPGHTNPAGGIRSPCLLGLEGSGSHGWAFSREIQSYNTPSGRPVGVHGKGRSLSRRPPGVAVGPPPHLQVKVRSRGWGRPRGPGLVRKDSCTAPRSLLPS